MQQIVFVGFLTIFYIGCCIWRGLRRKSSGNLRLQIIAFLFVEYVFCVLAVTLLPIYIRLGVPIQWSDSTMNFILFHFIKEYTQLIGMDLFYLKVAIKNLLGNVLLFVPLGLLVPILDRRFRSMKTVLGLSFVCSLSIELMQWIESYFSMAFRMTDIDDVILNCCGGIIGYVCYLKIIKKRRK